MIMPNAAFFFSIFTAFLISLPGALMAETAFDPETAQIYLPAPLTPQLTADGKTLRHGVPLKAVVADPDPAVPRRKIPAPAGLTAAPEAATASFSITYVPDGGTDPWGELCYTFPEDAKAAFNAAADIWANTVSSGVPITINACWADLGSSTTLGYSGGGHLEIDFTGAPRANTWYAVSLANALHGSDIEPGAFDMHITYNRNFTWYYGTDGNTPTGQYDLMTVVLHEIAHGLNFSGSMQYSGNSGSWGYGTGYPNIYDVFMRNGSGTELINTGVYPNPSTALGSVLTSNDIWFHGSAALAANGGQRVKMYAPGTWSAGSSYSHLDYTTFNNTSNQLMVYAISDGESIHDPGVVTRGLLQDLGWTVSGSPPPAITLYAIGGMVSGLAPGNSVVLQNNMGDDLTVTADGDFIFPTALVDGSAYAVTVLTQPDDPAQFCTVTNGTGTIAGGNVTNVDVNCINRFFWPMFQPAIMNNVQR